MRPQPSLRVGQQPSGRWRVGGSSRTCGRAEGTCSRAPEASPRELGAPLGGSGAAASRSLLHCGARTR